MDTLFRSPLFGIMLSILAYGLGVLINRKTRCAAANPLLIAILLVIGVLVAFRIPLESYQRGGDFIALFLAPATASLAVSIYRQLPLLKKNLLPVLAGCGTGSLASMGSVWLLCRLFRLDEALTASLLPKSVTTPIAIEIASQYGGIPSITVAIVVLTGILGAAAAPALIRLFRIRNPVEAGLAIGTCSHAVGTSKALELGEAEGAMSSIAIGVSGLLTVLFAMIIG
ncbi:MAG: LrgB family protein [Oscillospiraceae bacterium]|jgi:predicted murein hydrolase (TIGR00659 family)|nr:LrgB family protein [Oscillospiraceae bacterium]